MKYIKVNPTYTEVKVSDHAKKWEDSRPKRYWEYRQKWHLNPKNQIIEDFPLHIDFEASKRCNLRCPMCARTLKIERGDEFQEGDMDFNLFKKVIDQGAEKNLYSIKLNSYELLHL